MTITLKDVAKILGSVLLTLAIFLSVLWSSESKATVWTNVDIRSPETGEVKITAIYGVYTEDEHSVTRVCSESKLGNFMLQLPIEHKLPEESLKEVTLEYFYKEGTGFTRRVDNTLSVLNESGSYQYINIDSVINSFVLEGKIEYFTIETRDASFHVDTSTFKEVYEEFQDTCVSLQGYKEPVSNWVIQPTYINDDLYSYVMGYSLSDTPYLPIYLACNHTGFSPAYLVAHKSPSNELHETATLVYGMPDGNQSFKRKSINFAFTFNGVNVYNLWDVFDFLLDDSNNMPDVVTIGDPSEGTYEEFSMQGFDSTYTKFQSMCLRDFSTWF